jgi:hypothetical protein
MSLMSLEKAPFGIKRRTTVEHSEQNPHKRAIEHIVEATKEAGRGNHDAAEHHLNSALTWADMHAEKHRKAGKRDEANAYMEGVQYHVNRVRSHRKTLKSSSDQCDKDHSKLSKEGHCETCGFMHKSDLEKRSFPSMSSSPTFGSIKSESMKVGSPKKDTRYDYKDVADLHPHDQKLAQEKWGSGTGSYQYPVDRSTGRLAHATRVPTSKTPQAGGKAFKELSEQHRPGATVRIQGHPTHEGKLGIVRGSHPEFPGKVAVQVGATEQHKIYVEPKQVRMSKAETRFEKALITSYNIRKVFMKSETPDTEVLEKKKEDLPAKEDMSQAVGKWFHGQYNDPSLGMMPTPRVKYLGQKGDQHHFMRESGSTMKLSHQDMLQFGQQFKQHHDQSEELSGFKSPDYEKESPQSAQWRELPDHGKEYTIKAQHGKDSFHGAHMRLSMFNEKGEDVSHSITPQSLRHVLNRTHTGDKVSGIAHHMWHSNGVKINLHDSVKQHVGESIKTTGWDITKQKVLKADEPAQST